MTIQTTPKPTPEPQPTPMLYPRKQATIAAVFNGYPVAIQLADASIEAVEEAIGRLAQRAGWAAPIAASAPETPRARRPAAQLPPVTRYAGDGTPLCPEHSVPMRESQFGGFYCGEKGGAHVGHNGYCRCKA